MSPSKLILITGASGFIGAHVVQQALEAGYSVRATARPGKADALKAKFDGKIEVVPFADFINGDYTEALKGVDAIVHLASPLPWTANAAGLLEGAIGGALNILQQGVALGIKRAVITSSSLAVADNESDEMYTERVFTENGKLESWTREEVLKGDHSALFNYSVGKTLAEREIWKFADVHPEIDITTINPPYVFGPFVPGSVFRNGDPGSLSTVGTVFYKDILPDDPSSVTWTTGRQDAAPQVVDVRDLARAHVLALKAPPTSQVGRKRILLGGPTYTWFDAVKYLRATRPELSARLPQIKEGGEKVKIATLDNTRARDVLGLDEFIDWKKTVNDTVDFLLEVEKSWAKED